MGFVFYTFGALHRGSDNFPHIPKKIEEITQYDGIAEISIGAESVRSIFLPPEIPGNRVSAYGAICSAVGRGHGATLNWENTVQQKYLA